MIILAITDIPRLVNLFERLAQQHHGLVVVSEIHRGIERLKSIQPDVVIIQNHLAGLSADILHKHLKSRLGHRKVRFVLISTSDLLDVELSSRFEIIIDPALVDEQIEQQMQRLFNRNLPLKLSLQNRCFLLHHLKLICLLYRNLSICLRKYLLLPDQKRVAMPLVSMNFPDELALK